MFAPARRAPAYSRELLALVLLSAAGMAGCSGGKPTPQEEVDAAFKDNPQGRLKLAKFQGRVTVDGQPPQDYLLLTVVLLDAEKYQDRKVPRWQAVVDKEGNFSFMTYLQD